MCTCCHNINLLNKTRNVLINNNNSIRSQQSVSRREMYKSSRSSQLVMFLINNNLRTLNEYIFFILNLERKEQLVARIIHRRIIHHKTSN